MVRKGRIEEIFSKALHADDPYSYSVFFRDRDVARKLTLPDFIKESENFERIPISRIEKITRGSTILFEKIQRNR